MGWGYFRSLRWLRHGPWVVALWILSPKKVGDFTGNNRSNSIMGTYCIGIYNQLQSMLGYLGFLKMLDVPTWILKSGVPSSFGRSAIELGKHHSSTLAFWDLKSGKSTLKIGKSSDVTSSKGPIGMLVIVGFLEAGSFVALGRWHPLRGLKLAGGCDQGWKDSVATGQIAVRWKLGKRPFPSVFQAVWKMPSQFPVFFPIQTSHESRVLKKPTFHHDKWPRCDIESWCNGGCTHDFTGAMIQWFLSSGM